ncbi:MULTISPECIES: lipocalin family protein [Pontibacter]|uniref:Apolipoprotein D and lipocalin family protein n=1 Tax=Pontibacter lucknowensis TaxID=1077936 RepID=A0A1N6U4K1_9BACT|nr:MULTISPECIES: lipocalin family protein [Pontibacter]EJF09517.1 lipocalin [Pontibacter sp. BAB1700]SIQ60578.1 apolipoprotein D and lipocalin family protein [Pontibacter lucknowensis]
MAFTKKKQLLLTAGAVLLGAFIISSCSSTNAPLETVPAVDLERYMGKWYEIASIPQRFTKGCQCTTANYELNTEEGYVEVYNSCLKEDKVSDVKGKAFPVEGSNNSKLKVQFFWPFKGDYWILELDPAYRYVMVGSPDRESLWFLSRTPTMDDATYARLEQLAKSKGFPVEQLQMTGQPCAG